MSKHYYRFMVWLLGPNAIPLEGLDVTEMMGIDFNDYPDFVDAYIYSAYSFELDRELTDDELDWINNNETGFVYDQVERWIY